MQVERFHHVAYRCKDAKQTVEWYVKHLDMDFVLAIAEDQVPSTKASDPYMHVFLDAGGGNILAFFELPNSPEMGRDTDEVLRSVDEMIEKRAHRSSAKSLSSSSSAGISMMSPWKSLYLNGQIFLLHLSLEIQPSSLMNP